MPEGHTLHRLALTLDAAFAGTTPSVTSPQGRFAAGAARLDGRRVEHAHSWGKHLFVEFADDLVLGVHLGLIGVFSVTSYGGWPAPPPPPVGAVRVRLVNETHVADLRGATFVEVLTPDQVDATIARLGADPLHPVDAHNDPDAAFARIRRSGRSIAELLMDQSIIAGVGNLYRCEVLFRHRVDPYCPGAKLKPVTWRALWGDLVELMPIGVALGQIITLPEQVAQAHELIAAAGGELVVPWRDGAEAESRGVRRPLYEAGAPLPREFAVYQRTGMPCLTCGSRIRTAVVAGRNLFWCGRCQRRH